jgi:transposase
MLSQNNGNGYNTNIWWSRKTVLWIADVFREYGIEVEPLPEDYTSKECSICGNKHKNGRIYRGIYMQEDWEEGKRRYKCSTEHSEKTRIQDKDIKDI